MTDDAGGGRPQQPAETPAGVGAADPAADPATGRGLVPAGPGAAGPAAPPRPAPTAVRSSRTGGLWVGLILSALVLLLLLVFILQNGAPVQISFFALEGTLPTGVALLLAAIAGILLVAIPGSMRILQLRRAARRERR